MMYSFEGRLVEVCEILNRHPLGLSMVDLAWHMGSSVSRMRDYMRALRDQDRIVLLGAGRDIRRVVLARHVAAAQADMGSKQTDKQRAAAARKAAAKAEGRRTAHDDWGDAAPVRVIVAANDARPIPKPGPASVWELAA